MYAVAGVVTLDHAWLLHNTKHFPCFDDLDSGLAARSLLAAVHRYYKALDAPKTGVEVIIPHRYKVQLERTTLPGGRLPPWHSRRVKQEARAASMGVERDAKPEAPVDTPSRLCRLVPTTV